MRFGLLYLPTFDAATHVDSNTLYQQIFEQVELGEALGYGGAEFVPWVLGATM